MFISNGFNEIAEKKKKFYWYKAHKGEGRHNSPTTIKAF
jgi:hypothetical protein